MDNDENKTTLKPIKQSDQLGCSTFSQLLKIQHKLNQEIALKEICNNDISNLPK